MARLTLTSVSKLVDQMFLRLERVEEQSDNSDKILVRGNGHPSLQEEVRTLGRFINALRFWGGIVGVAIIGELTATLWYMMTHIYPLMLQLQAQAEIVSR